jgi:hypothetical protein
MFFGMIVKIVKKSMNYKLALLLFNKYNSDNESEEWVQFNLNQVLTSRQTNFQINKNNNLVVGMNPKSNCIYYYNGRILPKWLNKSFKISCKQLLLTQHNNFIY